MYDRHSFLPQFSAEVVLPGLISLGGAGCGVRMLAVTHALSSLWLLASLRFKSRSCWFVCVDQCQLRCRLFFFLPSGNVLARLRSPLLCVLRVFPAFYPSVRPGVGTERDEGMRGVPGQSWRGPRTLQSK